MRLTLIFLGLALFTLLAEATSQQNPRCLDGQDYIELYDHTGEVAAVAPCATNIAVIIPASTKTQTTQSPTVDKKQALKERADWIDRCLNNELPKTDLACQQYRNEYDRALNQLEQFLKSW